MDEQLQKWQQQYQNSTPSIDTQQLVKQVRKQIKKEKIKAWLDVIFGIIVSVYCLWAMIWFADSWQGALLFAALTPVPTSFGIWAFKLRNQQWGTNSLDPQALLIYKEKQLYTQLAYWRMSAILVGVIWIGLVAVMFIDYINNPESMGGILLIGINAIVAGITCVWYAVLKRTLPNKLRAINILQG